MAKTTANIKKVGFLNSASPNELALSIAAFRSGMKQAGALEKKDMQVSYQYAKNDLEKLPQLAQKLVQSGVDILAATGGIASAQAAVDAVRAAGKATRVVFVAGFDPNNGLPKGQMTGIHTETTNYLWERLKLAKELLGKTTPIAMLVRDGTAVGDSERAEFLIQWHGGNVRDAATKQELRAEFIAANKANEALIVSADPFYTANRKEIVRLAKESRVPAVYAWKEYVEAGGLMSFGPNLSNAYRQAGVYVGRMVLDAKYRPSVPKLKCFDIAINLKTAKALEIAVPVSLLARANYIVE